MCNSALPRVQRETAAHAEPPVLAAATGTVAIAPSGMMARPSFPEALVRRSPWPPPGQGGSACAAVSRCTRGG
eukprot:10375422-Alexandrium_andersonii.AAC.1